MQKDLIDNPTQNKTKMSLNNNLIDACVVVGMDEQTGLLPIPNASSRGEKESSHAHDELGPFQLNVLAVLTGTTAFFPCQQTEISGGDYYPDSAIICPCVSANAPTIPGRKMRRTMSYAPNSMPFSAEVVQSLPPFCFPDGGYAHKKHKAPYMHYLVLTNIDGGRTYCCALIITRKFAMTEISQLSNGYDLHLDLHDPNKNFVHVPFSVCLVSKLPYFNTMKDILSSLLTRLKDEVNVWPRVMKFASKISCILAPPPGNLSIEVELFGSCILVPSADENDQSVVDMDLHLPLLVLSYEEIVKIISCILTEQRLIFICSNQALIPLIIESFFTFIEPFKWRRTYVPVLPDRLADLIEAPGPFIMGCHSRLRSHIRQVIRMEEIPSIVLVDLDKGHVEVSPGEKIEVLPDFISQALVVRLRQTKFQYDLELTRVPTFFDMKEAKKHRDEFNTKLRQCIKDACLDMMVSLFADVTLFTRVDEKFFDKEGYLKSKLEQDQAFFKEACAADAFDRFVDDRLENPSRRDTFAVLAEKVVIPSSSSARKRSTSNLTRTVVRSSNSLGNIHLTQKTIFKQPKFLKEAVHTGKYFEKCVRKITSEIESLQNRNISLKASYLYLRGMLYVANQQPIKGLRDFHSLYSANQELFPSDYVQSIMASLDPATEESLQQQDFYKRAAIFRIFQKRTEEQTAGRPMRKLPSSPLGYDEFTKRVKALQLVQSDEASGRLFAALTHNKQEIVSPEQFSLLYNTVNKTEHDLELVELPGAKLIGEESLVLCSPLINTTRGMGRIALSTNNLFFLGDGVRETFFISKLRDVKEVIKYQHYVVFPPGVAALRIVNKDRNTPSFFACLKEDRDLWVTVLNEMVCGSEQAFSQKEPKIILQAENNVTLTYVLVQMGILEKVASAVCYLQRIRDNSDHQELSDETREALERRLDPCIKETNRTTVTCLTYVVGKTREDPPTLWCGLGSGTIIVYEVESWSVVSELRYAKHRISCLVPVGDGMVWVGSFDSVIYVINTDTRKAEQQLQKHMDFVSDIVYEEATGDSERDVVWSASFIGQVIKWDPETREIVQEISLNKYTKTLSRVMIVGERLWCGSQDMLLVIDIRSGDVVTKLRRYDEIGMPLPMECYCKITEKFIWSFGRKKGQLFIWNTKSFECKPLNLGDDLKASTILPIGNKVWIGDKDGKVFVVDANDFTEDRELHAHTDKVTCICITDEGHVITGSSSKEGKLCVWSTFFRDKYDEAHSLGFDVLDGGLQVKSKLRNKRQSRVFK